MAKYEIKMSCGHTETIQLFGKMTDRDKKIAWLEEHGICTACYKARIAAAHDAETTAAAAKAEEENLPEINGSEKQIAWALSIRAKKFEALNEMFANANANATDEQRQQNQIALQAAKNVLSRKTQSRFWIDNRNVEARKLIAANNLQDELKEEFARLNAEVERNEVLSTPTVTTAAQDIAVAAEIELATANNTADNITNDEHEQEASTMTITTTTNKAGKISGYYVDGVKTRKADIDFIINRRHDEIIVVDYYVGTEFKSLTRSPYQLKVVFTGTEHPIMTQAAADELGYKIVKAVSGSYNGTTFVVAKQADVDKSTIDNTTTTDVDDDDNDDDDVFALLPDADELNDVENFDDELILPTCVVDEKIYFTPIGNEFCNITVVDEYVHFFNGKLFLIRSPKYRARWQDGYFYANLGDIVKPFDSAEEFFAEMAKRGACTIDDEPEPPTDDFATKLAELQAKRDAVQAALLKAQEEHEAAENSLKNILTDTAADLTTKLQSIKLDYRIKLIKKSCWTFSTTNFDDVYISAYRGGCGVKFHFEDWTGRTLAKYDTPAQVSKVIDMLRAAIERGDTKFKFPAIDELNQPPIEADLERKIGIEDSLRRARRLPTRSTNVFCGLPPRAITKARAKIVYARRITS